MPINGVPSDQWKTDKALGPYAKSMDELELLEEQRLIKLKRIKNKDKGADKNG